ncbi:uncharacterized protein LOC122247884 isoform X2 [Penaeus japonicus]|nr:uncharacterized protein LOC122247884 isoform X2 [Penaeus japonicus]XP_042863513.1 uncharacterized protein LOC122247884 isoform X2 [Penaeus japonicus]
MSSSCVPPKNCVVHDPDPGSHSHDNDDSRSECGSLCTCTSSSMTSIATSVSRDPRGSSISLANPAAASPAPNSTSASAQTQETSENPFIVVFVPPQMLSSRRGCGTCGTCYGETAMKTALRVVLRTTCEFFPWVAGFVAIYYTFYWWGLGSGFSAFLFMMGTHALIRFIRARSSSECLSKCSRRDVADAPNAEEGENGEEESGQEEQREEPERPPDIALESPPSYEAAVVKPPPYDLYHHLTPTQPRSALQAPPITEKKLQKSQFLGLPNLHQPPGITDDEDDDVFLPSYQEAVRLSLRSEKKSEGQD